MPCIYIWLFASMGGLAVKGGYMLRTTTRKTPVKAALNTVIAVSVYLAMFEGAMLIGTAAISFGPTRVGSAYFQRAHLFWIGMVLLVALYPIPALLKRFELVRWQALSHLKALPIASPAFCFGLPVLLKSNVSPIAINEKILVGYVILSSISGVLYLVFLVFFALANNFVTRDAPTAGPIVLGGDTARQRKEKHDAHVRQATVWGVALIGSATFLVMLAVLDLLFVAVLGGQPAPASPPSTPTSLTVAPMP